MSESTSFKTTLFKLMELNKESYSILFNGMGLHTPSHLPNGKKGDDRFIWHHSTNPDFLGRLVVYQDQEITVIDGITVIKGRFMTYGGQLIEEFNKQFVVDVVIRRKITEADLMD